MRLLSMQTSSEIFSTCLSDSVWFYLFIYILLAFQTFSCAHQSSVTSEAIDWYVAICDYEAVDETELSLKAGDVVEILDYCDYNPKAK